MEDKVNESKTCARKNYTLNLSDADTERIARKAGKCNLTVSQLIENFIGDLIDGTYTNGSDERMYANQWFDRCWFAHESDHNLITFICDHNYDFEDIQKILQAIENTQKHIRKTQDEIESTDDSWQDITQMSYDDSGKATGYIRAYETHEDFVADCREAIESYIEDLKDYSGQLDDIKTEFSSYMGSKKYDWGEELQIYLQWYTTSVHADIRDNMESLTKLYYENHKKSCDPWENGAPAKSWWDKEGNLCIEYKNGKWWHYNDHGEWY